MKVNGDFYLDTRIVRQQDGRAAESIARKVRGVLCQSPLTGGKGYAKDWEVLWKLQGGNREAPAWRKDLPLCPCVFQITGICLP